MDMDLKAWLSCFCSANLQQVLLTLGWSGDGYYAHILGMDLHLFTGSVSTW